MGAGIIIGTRTMDLLDDDMVIGWRPILENE